jgi:DNA/RNA-binding domain of Phe-tRNA-synthetase-like protein
MSGILMAPKAKLEIAEQVQEQVRRFKQKQQKYASAVSTTTPQERAEAFVRAWQTSASVDEVSRKLQLKLQSCRTTAGKLRRRGVKLKKMPIIPEWDVAALNRIIDDLECDQVRKEIEAG